MTIKSRPALDIAQEVPLAVLRAFEEIDAVVKTSGHAQVISNDAVRVVVNVSVSDHACCDVKEMMLWTMNAASKCQPDYDWYWYDVRMVGTEKTHEPDDMMLVMRLAAELG